LNVTFTLRAPIIVNLDGGVHVQVQVYVDVKVNVRSTLE
jgi:flagellar assembly factor FliW